MEGCRESRRYTRDTFPESNIILVCEEEKVFLKTIERAFKWRKPKDQ